MHQRYMYMYKKDKQKNRNPFIALFLNPRGRGEEHKNGPDIQRNKERG